MKKMIFAALLLSFNVLSYASGIVTFLEVEEDVVLFSISDSKTGNSPSCVAVGNDDLWSLSLSSDSGRAIYSLMLTSMASDDVGLTVESANDCGVETGIERASKVSLVTTVIERGAAMGNSGVALYTGDGLTRLGPIIRFEALDKWWYLDESYPTEPAIHVDTGKKAFYFSEVDCQGDVYSNFSPLYEYQTNAAVNWKYYVAESETQTSVSAKSLSTNLNTSVCTNDDTIVSRNRYLLVPTEHPLCGSSRCILKED